MQPTEHTDSPSPAAAFLNDRSGLPLSTRSAAAAQHYRDAVERIHAAEDGAEALIEQAIALDPGFALAHAARQLLAHGAADSARASLAQQAAATASRGASAWERGHVECMGALLSRRPDAAQRVRAHLAQHPEDLLIASQWIGDLFFHGGVGKRKAVVEVLRGIEPSHRHDWAFQARLGFHLSELGETRQALGLLNSALAARPQAPFVAHAMAHALLESGQRAASHRFLSEWVDAHDASGPLDGHIHWHVALGELEAGRSDAAVARYRERSAPGVSHCALGLLLADAGGLFGRIALDASVQDAAVLEAGVLDAELHAPLSALLGELGGAMRIPFVAVHASALGLALGGGDIARCADALGRAQAAGATDTARRVVAAFAHYAAGDMAACLAALQPGRARAWEELGGSNEERALIAKLHTSARARLKTTGEPGETASSTPASTTATVHADPATAARRGGSRLRTILATALVLTSALGVGSCATTLEAPAITTAQSPERPRRTPPRPERCPTEPAPVVVEAPLCGGG